ncbi:hypothetical protein [Lysobacter sp. Root690]|uniref:hypothetical protein n=1 Tax=Lysobacter sp. Root690 TaxID=1736588 RepID=UPI000B13DFAC|nr:hypothetical protein [Lysobacter sp. Root690]
MNSNDLFVAMLGPLMSSAPHVLVCTVGLVLCLARRTALGTAGTYGSLGFALLIGGSLVGLAGQAWFLWGQLHDAATPHSIAIRIGAFGVVTTVMHAIAMGLLVAAIIARRPAQAA